MVELEELEKIRTIEEMRYFYFKKCDLIREDEKSLKEVRLKTKKFAYKELQEEYYPFMTYLEIAYKGQDVKARYVGRLTQIQEQKYDGEIIFPDGSLEKVEIAAPRDGLKEKKDALSINSRGYSECEIYDLEEKWAAIRQTIIETANKKSDKMYSGITIVISFEYTLYINPLEVQGLQKIEQLIGDLKKIKYYASNVYLLIPPFSTVNRYMGAIYKIY